MVNICTIRVIVVQDEGERSEKKGKISSIPFLSLLNDIHVIPSLEFTSTYFNALHHGKSIILLFF